MNVPIRKPTLQELATALIPLVTENKDWGTLVYYDEEGRSMTKFVAYYRHLIANTHKDFVLPTVEGWDLTDLSKWRQPWPEDWSADRCRARMIPEEQLADCLAPLEQKILGRLSQAHDPDSDAAAKVRRALRSGTISRPDAKSDRAVPLS